MENNQPKKKNAGLTALIALLLVITTIASCIGIYAWARYISSRDGNATAPVAKWNFNVSLKKGQQNIVLGTDPLDLATTLDSSATHVANGKIAPGTSGTFDIEINTTGTEVDLQYDVTISLANCPRNITFSRKTGESGEQDVFTPISAGGASNDVNLTRTGITFSEYVANADTGVHTERIKWEWPYDAGQNASVADQTAYDTRDNEDENIINASQSKKVTMNITVTGEEVLFNPNAADKDRPGTSAYVATHASTSGIDIGQSVAYTPDNASINNETLTLAGASIIGNTKVADLDEASLDGTISSSEAGDWVILDFDKTSGQVRIIPKTCSETGVAFYGINGYNNAITILDKIASIYNNATYSEESKCIREADFYNSIYDNFGSYVFAHIYGVDSQTGNIVLGGGDEEQYSTNGVDMITGKRFFYRSLKNYSSIKNDKLHSILTELDDCWMAERYIWGELENNPRASIVLLHDGGGYLPRVGDNELAEFISDYSGNESTEVVEIWSDSYSVVPVVTLKTGIHMTYDSQNNIWILSQN